MSWPNQPASDGMSLRSPPPLAAPHRSTTATTATLSSSSSSTRGRSSNSTRGASAAADQPDRALRRRLSSRSLNTTHHSLATRASHSLNHSSSNPGSNPASLAMALPLDGASGASVASALAAPEKESIDLRTLPAPDDFEHQHDDAPHTALLDGAARRPSSDSDVESQKFEALKPAASGVAAEYDVATRTKLTYLAGYFALNLSLTIYNKAVLGSFHFPWLLTVLHASCVSLGCTALLLKGHFTLSKLDTRENLILVAFSFLFTINIAISNVSLAAVSVPFHQIMRSTCPIFTIIIYRLWYSRTYSHMTYVALIPVMFGVALATYGDYYFTPVGFFLTLLGVVLASVKTVVSNRLMTGSLALPALEILLRMSPLAALQGILYAFLTGELGRFFTFVGEGHLPGSLTVALVGNGILAFVLNISSFQTNKLAGALTLTVAGNMKQCLTILLGIVLFNVRVSPTNGLGMFIAICGAGWYSKVELDSKGKK